MKLKWISLAFSVALLGITFYLTLGAGSGFKQGIDFAGGIKLKIEQNEQVTIEKLREFFEKEKITAVVQSAGKEAADVIKVELGTQEETALAAKARELKDKLEKARAEEAKKTKKAKKSQKELAKQNESEEASASAVSYLLYSMKQDLGKGNPDAVKFISTNQVGPTIGKYLTESAVQLLLITLALITVYVAIRFRINFAAGAMLALLHDLFMTLGFIGLLQISLSIPVVAALLTILGYSINDTIVVFDRIRENDSSEEKVGFERTVDRSITESLSRTIITSVTTLIAVGSVYLLGGEGLKDMAAVLILGIIIGTYSSTFIASPVVVIGNKFFKSA